MNDDVHGRRDLRNPEDIIFTIDGWDAKDLDDAISIAKTENGYRLGPGAETAVPLTAMELSVVADAADTDVRVLLLDEF